MESKDEIVRRIAADSGLLPRHVERIILTAPLRYKIFEIPKRGGGMREVAQPAREVKTLQRWVVRELKPFLPIHSAATAYQTGSSIARNAKLHCDSRYMLKLDFSNFFPSIMRGDIRAHLDRYCAQQFDAPTRILFSHLMCWVRKRLPPLRLCIGAPSSPFISNSILYDFDCSLSDMANKHDVTYTRYADDITLSARRRDALDGFVPAVRSLLDNLPYPRLAINEAKTVHASRAGRRVVTGLVLTPEGLVSIGRERKRLIRALYHRSLSGQLDPKQLQQLAGLMAFAEGVEPGFCARLSKRLDAAE